VPIHVGGVQIEPRVLLHGDRNGVTTIANEMPPKSPRLRRAGRGRADRARLSQGKDLNPKGYGEARKACKERIDALANRLKGK